MANLKELFGKKIILNSFHFLRIFAVWLCAYFYITHVESKVDRFVNHFGSLQFSYSESNRALQAFIISGYREPVFYKNGTQRDIADFDSSQVLLIHSLEAIKDEASSNHVPIDSEISTLLQLHHELADSVALLRQLFLGKGYKDFGAEGKIRHFAHYLEDSSTMLKQEILMMRRREKDYIMREEPKYISEFNNLADEQLTKFSGKPETKLALENYKNAFNEYVKFSGQIGFYTNVGLYQSIEHLVAKMDASYHRASDKIASEVKRINLIINIILTITFAFLLAAAIGLNFDIRKRQRELEKTSKDLSDKCNDLMQFNYIVSHNLRSPLANIVGMAQVLHMSDTTEDERDLCIDHLVAAAGKMDAVISELNAVIQSKSSGSRKEKVSIPVVLEGITDTLQKQISDSGAKVFTDIGEDANELFTVKVYLESVLYNLLSNAIKYRSLDKPAEIRITTRRNKKNMIITVADNGTGIDMKKNGKQLFGLYKRFNSTVEGKGLGLYITKSQVETLGGTIEVESEPGVGTKFKVTFPVI